MPNKNFYNLASKVLLLSSFAFWIATFTCLFYFNNDLGIFFPVGSFLSLLLFFYFAPQRNHYHLILSSTVLLLTVFMVLLKQPTVDDAYIVYRYAENLAEGKGLVYNVGSYVEGYSDFLWIIILSILHQLGAFLPKAAKLLGTLLLPFYYGICWLFLKEYFPKKTQWQYRSILLVCCLANVGIAYWATTGMETTLFSLLFLTSCLLFTKFLQHPTRTIGYASFFCFLLASLTRTEGIVFGFLAIFFVLWKYRQHLFTTTMLFAPYSVYLLFRWSYYGSLISQVMRSKGRSAFFLSWYNGFIYAFTFFLISGILLALLIAIPSFLRNKDRFSFIPKSPPKKFLLFTVICQLTIVLLSKGDWMPLMRLFVPIFVLLLTLLMDWFLSAKVNRRTIFVSFGIITLLSATSSLGQLAAHRNYGIDHPANIHPHVGKYIKTHASPESVIISHDAGIIAYFNKDLFFYDMDILVSSEEERQESKKKLPDNSFFYVTPPLRNEETLQWGENTFYRIPQEEIAPELNIPNGQWLNYQLYTNTQN